VFGGSKKGKETSNVSCLEYPKVGDKTKERGRGGGITSVNLKEKYYSNLEQMGGHFGGKLLRVQ